MDARPAARDGESLDGGVEILAARPRERRDGGSAHGRCDCAHAFEVAGRGDGEPGLDHVDPQLVEHVGDLDLLVGREGDARRLLAVSQGGVEKRDPAVPHWLLLRSGSPRGRTSPALRSVCAPQRRVSAISPRRGESGSARCPYHSSKLCSRVRPQLWFLRVRMKAPGTASKDGVCGTTRGLVKTRMCDEPVNSRLI